MYLETLMDVQQVFELYKSSVATLQGRFIKGLDLAGFMVVC